eukprot:CAMPEP_0172614860 /NCGR_PEP_ID=MMETSP1068-20121228/55674_1 /TAXON_ID=35684 /ORGANISM="Pseudopedinella elastica, Strain CCMP716" /LENGTH=175 /DNA_ID=CAMNT_0013419811 /DNA_START=89 /DNA_END=613 /DNA_ORIENTATION=-
MTSQPWRPRKGAFSNYERQWREAQAEARAKHDFQEKSLAENRRQSRMHKPEKFDGRPKDSKVDESEEALKKLDDEALLERARAALAERRLNARAQKNAHAKSAEKMAGSSVAPAPSELRRDAALKPGNKAIPKGRLTHLLSLSSDPSGMQIPGTERSDASSQRADFGESSGGGGG